MRSRGVVPGLRQASVTWAEQAYAKPQTQLARLDPHLTPDERRQLLEAVPDEADDSLTAELERIESYCRSLATHLS